MNPPQQWPAEVVAQYEPQRVLGTGGFASVVLAKRKNAEAGDKDQLVAIKVVGSKNATDFEVGYAHREISILKELFHPRIMRLIDSWEPAPEKSRMCVAVMALSYAKGNTLDLLLRKGGAPSLTFGRVVMAQLVDAIAYMHSHAVIHRDIKPDNIVIKTASTQQDDVWEETTDRNWEDLRKKWHLTLIDFGFSRALSEDELETDVGLFNTANGNIVKSDNCVDLNQPLASEHSMHLDQSNRSIGSSRRSMEKSRSKKMIRSMTALGNLSYAAPEIKSGVRKEPINSASHTLSSFVSDYGMVADAFSLGATIRYTLSGVPPEKNIQEVINSHKSPIAKVGRWLSKKKSKHKSKEGEPVKRMKNYRAMADFNGEASLLVSGLTHWKAASRTTVRMARMYQWVDDVLEDSGNWKKTKVQYLKCAADPDAIYV